MRNIGVSNNYVTNYGHLGNGKGKAPVQEKPIKIENMDQSNNHSISNTIQDLNMKLGEIISNNSKNYGNYFETGVGASTNNPGNMNDPFLNETITNLDNFLTFLKKNPQQQQKISDIPEILAPIPNNSQHRHSNTIADSQVKQLGIHQTNSLPNTYRGSETPAPTLTQQLAYHSRTNSQGGATNLVSSSASLARKSHTTKTTTTGTIQHNNYVNSNNLVNLQTSPFKENKLNTDRPHSSMGLDKAQTKPGANLVTKIKNFDEVLKHTDQNAGTKVHSSQLSQRSLSRESKKGSASGQNYSGKNSITKTPRTIESASRERSTAKNVVQDVMIAKTSSLTSSTSKLNVKQIDSATRSNLGSTQSSLKSTTKVDYVSSFGNHTPNQNTYLNTDRGPITATSSQNDQTQRKSHTRINSGNPGGLTSNAIKAQPNLTSAAKISIPLTSQNFFASSNNSAALNGNSSSLRDLKSRGTYYEQRRQPASLTGTLTKKDLQRTGQNPEMNKLVTQNNSKAGSTDVSNHNYGEAVMTEGLNSARPASGHKYTKSESKYNKIDAQKGTEIAFKIEEPLSHRKLNQENNIQGNNRLVVNKISYGNPATQIASPNKPVYTYNQNNILNIFLHPNQDLQKDQIIIKTETDRFVTNTGSIPIGQQDYTLSSKNMSKKAVSPFDFQYNNDPPNSHRSTSGANTKRVSSNVSPLKTTRKEDWTTAIRCKLHY